MHTDIHALGGIRTHDPSVRASERQFMPLDRVTTVIGERTIHEWLNRSDLERSGHGLIQLSSRDFSGGTEENYENVSSNRWCPGRDLNLVLPEYESTLLSLGQAAPFFFYIFIIWFVRLLALRPLLAYCASLG
jgi:hypothetical protein